MTSFNKSQATNASPLSDTPAVKASRDNVGPGAQDALPQMQGASLLPIATEGVTDAAPTESETAEYHAHRINKLVRKTREYVFALAGACFDATRLGPTEQNRLFRMLDVDISTFNKFVRIAENANFGDPNIQQHCPAGWTILALLSKWEKADFDAAIDAKVLTPATSRERLKRFYVTRHRVARANRVAASSETFAKDQKTTSHRKHDEPLLKDCGSPDEVASRLYDNKACADGAEMVALENSWKSNSTFVTLWAKAPPKVRQQFMRDRLDD